MNLSKQSVIAKQQNALQKTDKKTEKKKALIQPFIFRKLQKINKTQNEYATVKK